MTVTSAAISAFAQVRKTLFTCKHFLEQIHQA
jgi:hypothetical protein